MDQTTAIELSCCILELGNHSLGRVKTFQEIQQSPGEPIRHDLILRKCLGSMRMICNLLGSKEFSIERQDKISSQLREIAGEAILRMQVVSSTLETILNKCRARSRRDIASVTKASIKKVLGSEEIDQYVTDLERCIYDLSCIVALSTSNQLKQLSDQVGHSDVRDDIQTTHQELIEHIIKGNTTVSSATKLVRRGSAEARQMLHEHQILLRHKSRGQAVEGMLDSKPQVNAGNAAWPSNRVWNTTTNSFQGWLDNGSGIIYMVERFDSSKYTIMDYFSKEREVGKLLQQLIRAGEGYLVAAIFYLYMAFALLLNALEMYFPRVVVESSRREPRGKISDRA